VQDGALLGVVEAFGQDLAGSPVAMTQPNGASGLPRAISIARRM
jgi:hypothetical protein